MTELSGEDLKRLIKAAGYDSPADFAREWGLHRTTVNKYITEERSMDETFKRQALNHLRNRIWERLRDVTRILQGTEAHP